jgi:PKD repeat protein/photosystem II stability/assembly factor-like uncharacterized protein
MIMRKLLFPKIVQLCLTLFFLSPYYSLYAQTSAVEKSEDKPFKPSMKADIPRDKTGQLYLNTDWYKEINSANPNLYKTRQLFANYFETHPYLKGPQTNAYIQYLNKNIGNFDAAGNLLEPQTLKNSLFARIGRKLNHKTVVGNNWTNVFTKWNTTQSNGGTGVVRSIRIDPGNPAHVLIGSATAGMWKTSDGGTTWRFVSENLPEVTWVNDIAYIKNSPSIVYATTNVGVIKSTNGGETWAYTTENNALNFPLDQKNEIWLSTTLTDPNLVYITVKNGTQYELKKTTNGGSSWTTVYTFSGINVWDMEIKPDDPNIIYVLEQQLATTWVNLLRSTDGGVSFTKVNNGYPADASTASHRARLGTTPANTNVVYVATAFDAGEPNDKISFFKSTDAGISFAKKCCGDPALPLVSSYGATDFTSGTCHLAQTTWNFAFTVSETDENFIACALNKLKISEDGGNTWKFDKSGQVVTGSQYDNYASNNAHTGVHGDHHGLSIVGTNIWNANDGGVYHSADGGSTVAKDVTDGLGIQELWGFGQSFKNDIMAVGLNHNQICFRDDNVYGGWIGYNGADAMIANVNPIDDQYLYTHPWGHEKVKRSLTDKTAHVSTGLGIELGYLTYDNIDFHPNLYFTMYSSDYGDRNKSYRIAKSTDNAASWVIIRDMADIQKNAISLKVSYADPKYVYAVVEPNQVIKSIDEGQTWTTVAPPASLIGTRALWRLTLSDKNPNHLWVTVQGHQNAVKVIKSTDGGITWENYSDGLPLNTVESIIYQRGSDDILYVGTTLGVYTRKNGDSAWQKLGENLPGGHTRFMHINYAKGKLRVGTSRSIWETDLIELTTPKANISADRKVVSCTTKDGVIRFADYSVVDANATYSWTFPGGTPSTSTAERPVVTYASIGNYDVTLTVTDSRGTSTQTLINFVEVMDGCPKPVDFQCENGNALDLTAATGFVTHVTTLNSNTLTIAGWFKPSGIQSSYTGLVTAGPTGLILRDNNEVGYMWDDEYWDFASGLILAPDKWSHIALVIEGTQATVFLNGVAAVSNGIHNAIDFGALPFVIGQDRGRSDRNYNGLLDEFVIYNRALAASEIKNDYIHNTRTGSDTGINSYFQFNETSGPVLNSVTGEEASGLTSRVISTAPVGCGVTADETLVKCSQEESLIHFADYSVADPTVTYAWSFPGGTPSTSTNAAPIVNYMGASPGNYSVTLTKTVQGVSAIYTETDLIHILDECPAQIAYDCEAGNAANLNGTMDYLLYNTNLTSNTVTLSGWFKPDGVQLNDTGLMTSGATGIILRANNEIGYMWNDANWNWSSGLRLTENVWSHVALVIEPTKATLYLNGVAKVNTASHGSITFTSFNIGQDRNRTNRNYKGVVDEITVYNRAVPQTEIREMMHLTNKDNAVDLHGYLQFNEVPLKDQVTGADIIYYSAAGTVAQAQVEVSTAPVGCGSSNSQTMNAAGDFVFGATGVTLTAPAGATYPGEMVVSRIDNLPSGLPVTGNTTQKYWVIRHYGTAGFTPLTPYSFGNIGSISAADVAAPANLKLYKRESNDFGNTWGTEFCSASTAVAGASNTATFNCPISSFSQFILSSTTSALPVTFASVKVKEQGTHAKVTWKTTSEMNNEHFVVEHSGDAITFLELGKVMAKEGRENVIREYEFLDVNPGMHNYYRVKQVDHGGMSSYSNIVSLNRLQNQVKAYPNPVQANGLLSVDLPAKIHGVKARLINVTGSEVFSKTINNEVKIEIDMRKLVPGVYVLEVGTEKIKIVKQ